MKASILVFLLLSFSFAHAEDKKETKPLDLPDFSSVTKQEKTRSKMTVTSSCTSTSGRVFQSNEAGYEGCLQEVKMQNFKTDERGRKNDANPNSNPGASTNMNFQLGN